MGQRELLLTLGAMVIFGMTTITVNQNLLSGSEAIHDQQVEILTMNVAQKYIEDAKTKAFDENTINDENGITVNSFGNPGSLGPGTGESYPHNFDDVDDFNGLSLVDSSTTISMNVSVTVKYVAATDLNTPVFTKQFYKIMTVNVNNEYLLAPVQAQYVFAYQKN